MAVLRLPAIVIALTAIACGNPYDKGASGGEGDDDEPSDPPFSFFYTGLESMRRLSGSDDGFGGDLRYGGAASGIEGADLICQAVAEDAGAGSKTWRAFLSAVEGPDGEQVNAIDRIGDGPWYDRRGRLIANDVSGLIADRPQGDPDAVNDLPDETGEGTRHLGSSNDVLTGSNKLGLLEDPNADPRNTCMDWTDAAIDRVRISTGHSWLISDVDNWMNAHYELSCKPGVRLDSGGVSDGSSIGAGGGWGGFYCFALSP